MRQPHVRDDQVQEENRTYKEEDEVDAGGERPVKHRDQETQDGRSEQETHGVSVLLSGPVKLVLPAVLVNLLRDEAEEGDVNHTKQRPQDGLEQGVSDLQS